MDNSILEVLSDLGYKVWHSNILSFLNSWIFEKIWCHRCWVASPGYVCTPLKLPHPRSSANHGARLLVTWTNQWPVSGCRPESLWVLQHKMSGGGRLSLQYSHIRLSADKKNSNPKSLTMADTEPTTVEEVQVRNKAVDNIKVWVYFHSRVPKLDFTIVDFKLDNVQVWWDIHLFHLFLF